jgi:translocation protein SEC62
MSTGDSQAKAPPEIRNVVSFLRSGKAGMKIRVGALNGKRIDYFKGLAHAASAQRSERLKFQRFCLLNKGKSAIKALLSPAYAKLTSAPKVTSEAEAQALLHSIIPYAFFLRVERGAASGTSSSSPKHLTLVQSQLFTPGDFYAWFYEGSQWTTYVGGLLMVAVILGGVMFPLWPPVMRLGVWYLSMLFLGFIALFFVIAIIRLIFYVITLVVASPGVWIFPNLFADVGFVRIIAHPLNPHLA